MGMTKHDALPQQGSLLREHDRAEGDGRTPADYPLLARCKSCHREIRIDAYLGSGWKHTAAPRPPRDRADEIARLTEVADLYGEIAERLSELPVRTPKASGHTPGEATFESGKAMRLALDDT
jgi:hypothetical protein